MARKLFKLIAFPTSKEGIIEMCRNKGLNGYETEIILRIYWKKQNLSYISYHMDFSKYGKPQKYYSVRSINNFHRDAIIKLLRN